MGWNFVQSKKMGFCCLIGLNRFDSYRKRGAILKSLKYRNECIDLARKHGVTFLMEEGDFFVGFLINKGGIINALKFPYRKRYLKRFFAHHGVKLEISERSIYNIL
jgi:hypothetical protein